MLWHGWSLVAEAALRLSVQEEEKRYRPGTNKYIAFQVLKAAGPKGLTVPQIMDASKNAGWKEFDETAKRVIQFVRAHLPLLCVVCYACTVCCAINQGHMYLHNALCPMRSGWTFVASRMFL